MILTFHGAAKTVTGSCYLLETNGKKFLIDCGMFQGTDVEDRNLKFNFNPAEVDFLLLTHAHVDHCGLIPKLYREGFKGDVYGTQETLELTEILLYDSAKIQENRERDKFNREASQVQMKLYDTTNVDEYTRHTKRAIMNEQFEIDGIKITYIRAGHILGAASILIEAEGKKIVFSGDIGRKEQSLIYPYEYLGQEVDYVVMESLYGGQEHEQRELSIDKLIEIINNTAERDGNVMVPSFAVHRSQELLVDLYIAMKEGRINNNVQIFLDGPLSIYATQIYTKYLTSYPENAGQKGENVYPGSLISEVFNGEHFMFVQDSYVSKRISRKKAAVFIAGNGMCQGGRILNHLYKGIKKSKNSVVFVGFQAEDTLGRKIIEGNHYVRINNKNLPVKAEIHDLHGFSAHAAHSDLMDWFGDKNSERLKQVFLVHAEPDRSQNFYEAIKSEKYDVKIPGMYDSLEL